MTNITVEYHKDYPSYLSLYFRKTNRKIGNAMEKKELKKIPIEEAMEFFRKEGMEVDREETELVMEFLNNLTMIVIRECFDVE